MWNFLRLHFSMTLFFRSAILPVACIKPFERILRPVMKRLLLLLFLASPLFAQEKYDLLIKNATVIDPKNNIHEVRDVAIRDHKIVVVGKNIPTSDAAKTINAKGLYVTPGLVDIHTHVYAGTGLR